MKYCFAKSIKKRILAMMLIAVMVVGGILVYPPGVKASSKEMTLSYKSCGYNGGRYTIYMSVEGATIAWSDFDAGATTIMIDGVEKQIEGTGTPGWAVDTSNCLMLLLPYSYFGANSADEVTREHTIEFPEGTTWGSVTLKKAFKLTVQGYTLKEVQEVALTYKSGGAQADRYLFSLDMTGAQLDQWTDFESKTPILIDGVSTPTNGWSNWGARNGLPCTEMYFIVPYSMLGANSAEQVTAEHIIEIPAGATWGDTVLSKGIQFSVNGYTVKEVVEEKKVTLSYKEHGVQADRYLVALDLTGDKLDKWSDFDSKTPIVIDGVSMESQGGDTWGALNGQIPSEGIYLILPYSLFNVTSADQVTTEHIIEIPAGATWGDTTLTSALKLSVKGDTIKEYTEGKPGGEGGGEQPPQKPEATQVTISDSTKNTVRNGVNGIYFNTEPEDELETSYTKTYTSDKLIVNGVQTKGIKIQKRTKSEYFVQLKNSNVTVSDGMTVQITGELSDGNHAVSFKSATFKYVDSKWVLQTGGSQKPDEPKGMFVDILNDGVRNTKGASDLYFYVSPADELSSASGWEPYAGTVTVNEETQVSVNFYKAANNLYCLGIVGTAVPVTEGTKIKIDCSLKDNTHKVTFNPATFVRKNQTWVLDGSIESMDLDSAAVKVYDLFELESISEITIPKGKYYNLTDLKQGTNVGLKLKVNQLDEQVVFTLGKQTANNVWVASGYSVQLDSVGKYIQILTSEKKDGKESDIKRAELTNVDLSGSFELEYGVADMFEKNDKNTPVARRIYVKLNGEEVLSWIDTDLDRSLGTYVPAWASKDITVGSVKFPGYELVPSEVNVQDISELIDGVSTFETVPQKEEKVGNAKNATNNAVRTKVKWISPLKNDGDEMLISLSNGSSAGIWMGNDGGYNILFTKYGISIQHADLENSLKASTDYVVPNDEFLLEVGVYDMSIYSPEGKKAKDYSKVVYVKVDGVEVLTYSDKNLERNLGTNMYVYTSKDVKADFISLTSSRYFIQDKVTVSDLFDASQLSEVTLSEARTTKLGTLTGERNVAFRTRVKTSKECNEILFAISKMDNKQFWDTNESGWQFWLRPSANTIFIGYGASEVGAFRGYSIPEEFVLEIGERDVRYNNGERFCREVYMMIDNVEVLTYNDKDFSRKLGTFVSGYTPQGNHVVLESLTTKGYVPVEKNILVTDLFDASGIASKVLPVGTTYLGEISGEKNAGMKMHVSVNQDAEEFGIAFGKAVENQTHEGVKDAEVSGWMLWFKPKWNLISLDTGYFHRQEDFGYVFPKEFDLEVGSRDVYYKNGKYYGYEVYVKIDGETVVQWMDNDIKARKLGRHVTAFINGNANANVTISTLYPKTTLPVDFVINGEIEKNVESVLAETTVVTGKPSKIAVSISLHPDYNLINERVTLAGKDITPMSTDKLVNIYEVTAQKDDKVVVYLDKRQLKAETPETVFDFYEMSGFSELNIPGLGYASAGNMIQNGEAKTTNSALQFKVTLPKDGQMIRVGAWSDQKYVWGWNGFVGGIAAGKATIWSVGYDQLATGQSAMLKGGETVYVEFGMVKCYENNNYKYNRIYIKAGTNLENLEQICWYDSRERGGFGTTVSFLGLESDTDYLVESTQPVYSIVDQSGQADKDQVAVYEVFDKEMKKVYYPSQTIGYKDAQSIKTPASIKICPKEGKKVVKLIVSGKDVTNRIELSKDGTVSYTLPSVTENITFSYTIK